jgi:hypothetical protein
MIRMSFKFDELEAQFYSLILTLDEDLDSENHLNLATTEWSRVQDALWGDEYTKRTFKFTARQQKEGEILWDKTPPPSKSRQF